MYQPSYFGSATVPHSLHVLLDSSDIQSCSTDVKRARNQDSEGLGPDWIENRRAGRTLMRGLS